MNPTIDPHTDALIKNVIQALLKPAEKGECRCHWLDAKKTPILAWKGKADSLILKISTQKLLGFTRVDKNGGEYWKFQNAEELQGSLSSFDKERQELEKVSENEVSDKKQTSAPLAPVEPEVKPVVEKVKPEPVVNLPPAGTVGNQVQLESEAVKKFQAKYGTATNPKGE